MEQEEKQKLEQAQERFHLQELSKDQAEFSIGRNLSDDEWQAYIKWEYRKNEKPKDNVYSIKQLFKEPKVKLKPKFTLKDVAKHASKKAQRMNKKQDDVYRVAKLYKGNKNNYRIEKIREYKYRKFNSTRSEWKIHGDVDLFDMHSVIM